MIDMRELKKIDEKLWKKRDPEVHAMFEKIDRWLKGGAAGKFNTKYYDSLCEQWLEYGVLNHTQIQTLKNIIERCIPK